MIKNLLHRGLHYRRVLTGYSSIEKAFADSWEKECERNPGINDGLGTLQGLMFVYSKSEKSSAHFRFWGWESGSYKFWITRRDACIVATVIQWLGSNCGMAFLHNALHKVGLCIVPIERSMELQEQVMELRKEKDQLLKQIQKAKQILGRIL